MANYENALTHAPTGLDNEKFSVHIHDQLGFVVLRIKTKAGIAVNSIKPYLGRQLPGALQVKGDIANRQIQWISPDEYLITLPLAEKEPFIQDMQNALAGHFAAVIDNSGAYVLLEVTGSMHEDALKKHCVYDVSNQLPIGKAVGSVFSSAPVILYKTAPESVFLLVRNSFSDYVWKALQHSLQEYR